MTGDTGWDFSGTEVGFVKGSGVIVVDTCVGGIGVTEGSDTSETTRGTGGLWYAGASENPRGTGFTGYGSDLGTGGVESPRYSSDTGT